MIIYKTTNLINGKIYIGKNKHNNSKYLGSGRRLIKAIQKYGRDFFLKEIVEYCVSNEYMSEREKYWIDYFDSTNRLIGYNLTKGGEGGDTFTLRSDSEKMRTRKLISDSSVYWNNINRSRNSERSKRLWQTKEYSDNVRNGIIKSFQNPERRAKHSEIMKRICNTPEARAVRCKNATGRGNSTWRGYADLYDVNLNFIKRYECIGYLKRDYPLSAQTDEEIRNGKNDIIIKSSRKRKLEYEGYRIKITKE